MVVRIYGRRGQLNCVPDSHRRGGEVQYQRRHLQRRGGVAVVRLGTGGEPDQRKAQGEEARVPPSYPPTIRRGRDGHGLSALFPRRGRSSEGSSGDPMGSNASEASESSRRCPQDLAAFVGYRRARTYQLTGSRLTPDMRASQGDLLDPAGSRWGVAGKGLPGPVGGSASKEHGLAASTSRWPRSAPSSATTDGGTARIDRARG